jgi:hypothetical protein
MSRRYRRARHKLVQRLLEQLDADFLRQAGCFFGGGTRIVLELDEYRESADVDMLCSNRDGYRELRSAITPASLGGIARGQMALAREIVSDIYGIRTFVDLDGEKIKFEIVHEARIDLNGADLPDVPVSCLDRRTCFAEKFLANADRWADRSVLSRDVIDLAFMMNAWPQDAARQGFEDARTAYGDAVERDLKLAVRKLLEDKEYLKRCAAGLGITQDDTLQRGLQKLQSWKAADGGGGRSAAAKRGNYGS